MVEIQGTPLPSICTLLKEHKLVAHRSLGQNFLVDANISEKIAAAAQIKAGDTVLEVGPGIGSLTRHLINSPAKKIIVVEKDARFLPFLEDLKSLTVKPMDIILGDAMKIPLSDLSATPLNIVSNLPYNIGTPLILGWLNSLPLVKSLTLMLQKEVVDRLSAHPGNKSYGRLTIIVEWLMEVHALFRVPPAAFVPSPSVVSSVVKMRPRPAPLYPARKDQLEQVTARLFQQRRKMLRVTLKSFKADIEEMLTQLHISPEARPETLTVEQFCQLANALSPYLRS